MDTESDPQAEAWGFLLEKEGLRSSRRLEGDSSVLHGGLGVLKGHPSLLEGRSSLNARPDAPGILKGAVDPLHYPLAPNGTEDWVSEATQAPVLPPSGAPVQGSGDRVPGYYPDYIAISHTTSGPVADELAFQTHFYQPPTAVWAIPDAEVPEPQELEGVQLGMFCGKWSVVGECEEHHKYAKELICNREYCSICGGDGGKAHQRRKAAWLPKARQISSMGYFVITVPPELREKYRDPKVLSKAGTAFKRMFQRHGFDRGLRRWHTFGEDHQDASGGRPIYHPHLNVLVDGGFLEPDRLASIKRSTAAIFKVPESRVNVNYSYASEVPRMLHMVKYVLRPTFEHREWDPRLADELVGFHNSQTWGKWDGDPAWEVPPGDDQPEDIQQIQKGICPKDGTKISWQGVVSSQLITQYGQWEDLGAGYWRFSAELSAHDGRSAYVDCSYLHRLGENGRQKRFDLGGGEDPPRFQRYCT